MKIYKDTLGLWHVDGRIIPAGHAQLIDDHNGMIRIMFADVVLSQNVSDIEDSNGNSYGSITDFLTECHDFFVNPRLDVAYGELYGYNNFNSLSVPSGLTYTKASPFTNVGSSKNVICSYGEDNITIENDGFYKLNASFSSSVGTNNINLYTSIFVNGIEQNNMKGHRFVVNSNYVSTISLTGLLNLKKGDVIDVRVRHDGSSSVLLITDSCNLNIVGYENY